MRTFKELLYVAYIELWKMPIYRYTTSKTMRHISKATLRKVTFTHNGIGCVIGERVKFGNNVTVYQHTTIGSTKKDEVAYPTIEDDVTIYSHCCIIGDITIGKGSVIGAYTFVNKDIPPNSVVYSKKKLCIKKLNILHKDTNGNNYNTNR